MQWNKTFKWMNKMQKLQTNVKVLVLSKVSEAFFFILSIKEFIKESLKR